MTKKLLEKFLTKANVKKIASLKTPIKIQNYLDKFPVNWEKRGETYRAVREALAAKKMHCFEGALVAAAALYAAGQRPLLMDLKAKGNDDHVVALYQKNGFWGAISKTNHASLRFRDPVYKTLRELALSYFHEYFDNQTGEKILQSFSQPYNLEKWGSEWLASQKNLHHIVRDLDQSPHAPLVPKKNQRLLRPADRVERHAGKIIEWEKNNPRT